MVLVFYRKYDVMVPSWYITAFFWIWNFLLSERARCKLLTRSFSDKIFLMNVNYGKLQISLPRLSAVDVEKM